MGNLHIVKILHYKNLYRALRKSIQGRFKYKSGALRFFSNNIYNLTILKHLVKSLFFHNSGYHMFYVEDTKRREIHAPSFIDKLLQYALNYYMVIELEKLFISDSYACIRKKGPKAAIDRLKIYQCRITKYYQEPMLVKLDISKFFYSINRYKIFDLLCKRIKCLETRLLLIEKLKFSVSEVGLPLGNLTSQQFANLLLNEFDHYVKRILKIQYYLRYADDIFIFVDGKDQANRLLEYCKIWLKEYLDLECNPKKCYIRPNNEIIGLGYKILNTGELILLSRTKKKLYKYLKMKYVIDKSARGIYRRAWIKNKRSLYRPATTEDIVIRLNSWYGHAKLTNIHYFIYAMLERSGRTDIIFTGEKFIAI